MHVGPVPNNHAYWGISDSDLAVFKTKRNQGFDEFAHLTGWGKWKGDYRLMEVWAFFHKTGKVFVWTFVKSGLHHNRVMIGWMEFLSTEGLQSFLDSWGVTLGKKEKIEKVLDSF